MKLKFKIILLLLFGLFIYTNNVQAVGNAYFAIIDWESDNPSIIYRTAVRPLESMETKHITSGNRKYNTWYYESNSNVSPTSSSYASKYLIFTKSQIAEYTTNSSSSYGYLNFDSPDDVGKKLILATDATGFQQWKNYVSDKAQHKLANVEDKYIFTHTISGKNVTTTIPDNPDDYNYDIAAYNDNILDLRSGSDKQNLTVGYVNNKNQLETTTVVIDTKKLVPYAEQKQMYYNSSYTGQKNKKLNGTLYISDILINSDVTDVLYTKLESLRRDYVYVSTIMQTKSQNNKQNLYMVTPGSFLHVRTNKINDNDWTEASLGATEDGWASGLNLWDNKLVLGTRPKKNTVVINHVFVDSKGKTAVIDRQNAVSLYVNNKSIWDTSNASIRKGDKSGDFQERYIIDGEETEFTIKDLKTLNSSITWTTQTGKQLYANKFDVLGYIAYTDGDLAAQTNHSNDHNGYPSRLETEFDNTIKISEGSDSAVINIYYTEPTVNVEVKHYCIGVGYIKGNLYGETANGNITPTNINNIKSITSLTNAGYIETYNDINRYVKVKYTRKSNLDTEKYRYIGYELNSSQDNSETTTSTSTNVEITKTTATVGGAGKKITITFKYKKIDPPEEEKNKNVTVIHELWDGNTFKGYMAGNKVAYDGSGKAITPNKIDENKEYYTIPESSSLTAKKAQNITSNYEYVGYEILGVTTSIVNADEAKYTGKNNATIIFKYKKVTTTAQYKKITIQHQLITSAGVVIGNIVGNRYGKYPDGTIVEPTSINNNIEEYTNIVKNKKVSFTKVNGGYYPYVGYDVYINGAIVDENNPATEFVYDNAENYIKVVFKYKVNGPTDSYKCVNVVHALYDEAGNYLDLLPGTGIATDGNGQQLIATLIGLKEQYKVKKEVSLTASKALYEEYNYLGYDLDTTGNYNDPNVDNTNASFTYTGENDATIVFKYQVKVTSDKRITVIGAVYTSSGSFYGYIDGCSNAQIGGSTVAPVNTTIENIKTYRVSKNATIKFTSKSSSQYDYIGYDMPNDGTYNNTFTITDGDIVTYSGTADTVIVFKYKQKSGGASDKIEVIHALYNEQGQYKQLIKSEVVDSRQKIFNRLSDSDLESLLALDSETTCKYLGYQLDGNINNTSITNGESRLNLNDYSGLTVDKITPIVFKYYLIEPPDKIFDATPGIDLDGILSVKSILGIDVNCEDIYSVPGDAKDDEEDIFVGIKDIPTYILAGVHVDKLNYTDKSVIINLTIEFGPHSKDWKIEVPYYFSYYVVKDLLLYEYNQATIYNTQTQHDTYGEKLFSNNSRTIRSKLAGELTLWSRFDENMSVGELDDIENYLQIYYMTEYTPTIDYNRSYTIDIRSNNYYEDYRYNSYGNGYRREQEFPGYNSSNAYGIPAVELSHGSIKDNSITDYILYEVSDLEGYSDELRAAYTQLGLDNEVNITIDLFDFDRYELDYDEINYDNDELIPDNNIDLFKENTDEFITDLSSARTQFVTAYDKYASKCSTYGYSMGCLDVAQENLTEAEDNLSESQDKLSEAEANKATAQSEKSTAQSEKSTAQSKKATAQSEKATAQSELEYAEEQLEYAESESEAIIWQNEIDYWDWLVSYWDGQVSYWDGRVSYWNGQVSYWNGQISYWNGKIPGFQAAVALWESRVNTYTAQVNALTPLHNNHSVKQMRYLDIKSDLEDYYENHERKILKHYDELLYIQNELWNVYKEYDVEQVARLLNVDLEFRYSSGSATLSDDDSDVKLLDIVYENTTLETEDDTYGEVLGGYLNSLVTMEAKRPTVVDEDYYTKGIPDIAYIEDINEYYYSNNEFSIPITTLNGKRVLASQAKYTISSDLKVNGTSDKLYDNVYYTDQSDTVETWFEIDTNYYLKEYGYSLDNSQMFNIYTPLVVHAESLQEQDIIDQTMGSPYEDNIGIVQTNSKFSIKLSSSYADVASSKHVYDEHTPADFTNRYLKNARYYVKFEFIVDNVKYKDASGYSINKGTYDAYEWIGPIYGDKLEAIPRFNANEDASISDFATEYYVIAVAINAKDSWTELLLDTISTKLADIDETHTNILDSVQNICGIEGDEKISYYADTQGSIVVVNRMYDFRVTDISDVNWKEVFRLNESKSYVNTHSGIAYYSGFSKWNTNNPITYNEIIGRTEEEIGNSPARVLPVGPYKNTDKTYVAAPKMGYRFSYDLKVTGAPNADKSVTIKPRFYYVSKDGTKFYNQHKSGHEGIYLFYKNNNGQYVRVGSSQDKYKVQFIPNDGYRALIQTTTNNLSKSNIVLGSLTELTLKYNEVTTYSENAASITYYGEYKLPNSTIAVYVDSSGKYNINNPLKDGYIGVVFDIYANEPNGTTLSYSQDSYIPAGETNAKPNTSQWDYESYLGITNRGSNYSTTLKLEKGTWSINNATYNAIKGTVILYDLDNRASNDYN